VDNYPQAIFVDIPTSHAFFGGLKPNISILDWASSPMSDAYIGL